MMWLAPVLLVFGFQYADGCAPWLKTREWKEEWQAYLSESNLSPQCRRQYADDVAGVWYYPNPEVTVIPQHVVAHRWFCVEACRRELGGPPEKVIIKAEPGNIKPVFAATFYCNCKSRGGIWRLADSSSRDWPPKKIGAHLNFRKYSKYYGYCGGGSRLCDERAMLGRRTPRRAPFWQRYGYTVLQIYEWLYDCLVEKGPHIEEYTTSTSTRRTAAPSTTAVATTPMATTPTPTVTVPIFLDPDRSWTVELVRLARPLHTYMLQWPDHTRINAAIAGYIIAIRVSDSHSARPNARHLSYFVPPRVTRLRVHNVLPGRHFKFVVKPTADTFTVTGETRAAFAAHSRHFEFEAPAFMLLPHVKLHTAVSGAGGGHGAQLIYRDRRCDAGGMRLPMAGTGRAEFDHKHVYVGRDVYLRLQFDMADLQPGPLSQCHGGGQQTSTSCLELRFDCDPGHLPYWRERCKTRHVLLRPPRRDSCVAGY